MQSMVSGQLGRVVYGQLDGKEDVYRALVDMIQQNSLHSGLIVTITGGLEFTRLSMPRGVERVDEPPGQFEMAGTAEAMGSGYFGYTAQTWGNEKAGIHHEAGEPFLHVHMTVSIAGNAYCGHLIEGCRVRSLHDRSHFVVVIAEAKGVDLSFHRSKETSESYPNGFAYYELKAM